MDADSIQNLGQGFFTLRANPLIDGTVQSNDFRQIAATQRVQ